MKYLSRISESRQVSNKAENDQIEETQTWFPAPAEIPPNLTPRNVELLVESIYRQDAAADQYIDARGDTYTANGWSDYDAQLQAAMDWEASRLVRLGQLHRGPPRHVFWESLWQFYEWMETAVAFGDRLQEKGGVPF